jgi:hypothetical protein
MSRSRFNFIIMVVHLLCIVSLVLFANSCRSSDSQAAQQNRYDYLHFSGPCLGGARHSEGQDVVDLRNGNRWCVPYDGSAPEFRGTLNLSAITANPNSR